MKLIAGKILCKLGLHDSKFYERWKGYFRPHFECKRPGCNYWME
jgi:hypothetical protein